MRFAWYAGLFVGFLKVLQYPTSPKNACFSQLVDVATSWLQLFLHHVATWTLLLVLYQCPLAPQKVIYIKKRGKIKVSPHAACLARHDSKLQDVNSCGDDDSLEKEACVITSFGADVTDVLYR